ncbi:Alpha/Beta hydrolase protein [Kalaharituber pfeilii]|nr:Alpha/Beta hydrolase protein [Kalaharituber pfeilii]
MPRVPVVGRLHLYLPPFRPRTPEDFHTPGESPAGFVLDASDAPSSSESAPYDPVNFIVNARAAERERLYYKFKREEEREQAQKQKKRRWFKDEANAFLSSTLPFWRRNSQEYVALVVSFCFLIVESIIRVITLALPTPVIHWCYQKSRSLFNAFSPTAHTTKLSTRREKNIVARVREADGFVELCAIWGYEAEEHIVQTKDGYLLGLHRVRPKGVAEKRGRDRTREKRRVKPFSEDAGKRVVYLHHGLLMNSEVWVCIIEKERCLPFMLVDHGYDVWLGNNRGNKYSKKCIHHSSNSTEFWDFSIDQFAMHDIPDSINYILETTKSRSLSYIGFSQGTAQAFASLSIHPGLNEKVDVFIALAPAMSPAGLHNPIVDALIKASPNILYLLFGRKSILSSTTLWQSIFYPPIFVRIIDNALGFLFNWRTQNISLNQKIAAYNHLYSFTSTKSVVHWFQIIRNKTFQMYDDDVQSFMNLYGQNFYRVARFPTRNITTPIVLVWGGSDSLVDIKVMLKELPSHTVEIGIDHYEHLDMLWANDVDKLVFPTVLKALETYSNSCEGELEQQSAKQSARSPSPATKSIPQLFVRKASAGLGATRMGVNHSLNSPVLPTYSDDERSGMTGAFMNDVDGTASSVAPPTHNTGIRRDSRNIDECVGTDTEEEFINYGYTTGVSHEHPIPSSSLTVVQEETASQAATPSERPEPQEPQGPQTPKAKHQHSSSTYAGQSTRTNSDPSRLSTQAPPPLTSNAFREFFTNPSVLARKLQRRSPSVSSAASNVSASAGSVHSGGSLSDNAGGSGKVIGPGGIMLVRPRAGAAVSVSTDQDIEVLDEVERRREKKRMDRRTK